MGNIIAPVRDLNLLKCDIKFFKLQMNYGSSIFLVFVGIVLCWIGFFLSLLLAGIYIYVNQTKKEAKNETKNENKNKKSNKK